MQSFTTRILVHKQFNPEFIFNRVFTINGTQYFITVRDEDIKSHFFKMEQDKGKWKIIDFRKVPEWIIQLESTLEKIIWEKIWP